MQLHPRDGRRRAERRAFVVGAALSIAAHAALFFLPLRITVTVGEAGAAAPAAPAGTRVIEVRAVPEERTTPAPLERREEPRVSPPVRSPLAPAAAPAAAAP
ncbi:MAG TPA: hypothetical protein VMK65_08225, partial [Longimicrobiales bacterium]|nr:hypothetical protein [Longimicrobiales bacterium]